MTAIAIVQLESKRQRFFLWVPHRLLQLQNDQSSLPLGLRLPVRVQAVLLLSLHHRGHAGNLGLLTRGTSDGINSL